MENKIRSSIYNNNSLIYNDVYYQSFDFKAPEKMVNSVEQGKVYKRFFTIKINKWFFFQVPLLERKFKELLEFIYLSNTEEKDDENYENNKLIKSILSKIFSQSYSKDVYKFYRIYISMLTYVVHNSKKYKTNKTKNKKRVVLEGPFYHLNNSFALSIDKQNLFFFI